MVRIGSSHWKPEMVDVKLSKAFIRANREWVFKKELRINRLSSYRVSLHSEMVGAHLLGHRPVASVGKHLLKEFQHFADFDLVCWFLGRILQAAILPSGVGLLLQRHYSAG
jgi:hypothetical protein